MRIGLAQIHRAPQPMMAAMMTRRRGVGQVVPIAPFPPLAQYLQEWFGETQSMSPTSSVIGCGPGQDQPCANPADAANMIYGIAAGQCNLEESDKTFAGYIDDPACNDQGVAAAAAIYPQILAYFNTFPASVWATEAANAASGLYSGPSSFGGGPCGAGMVFNEVNGVITCSPASTAVGFNSDQGPSINILTGAPITPAAPASSTPVLSTTPALAPSPAPSGSSASAPSQTTGTSSSSSTSSTAAATSDPFAFLTQDTISGIPNWMLLAGGLALVMILPSLLGGRR
jgi:hypothetical protein